MGYSPWSCKESDTTKRLACNTYLVSGLLRSSCSSYQKNSVRDIVIGKKWVYLERNTPHRMWALSEGKRPQNMVWLVFMSG